MMFQHGGAGLNRIARKVFQGHPPRFWPREGCHSQFQAGTVIAASIGVTLFGVLLTPVFFFLLLWMKERQRV
jgi:hypothetical protein